MHKKNDDYRPIAELQDRHDRQRKAKALMHGYPDCLTPCQKQNHAAFDMYNLNWVGDVAFGGSDRDLDVLQQSREHMTDALQPKITSSSSQWVATIYYNPEMVPTAASLERIIQHYAKQYPSRTFALCEIRAHDLQNKTIGKFPRAETALRQRGFVSDIEVDDYGQGGHHPKTTYLSRNRAAANFQLTIIETLLKHVFYEVEKGWLHYQLFGLMGKKDREPLPLVDHDGLLLPRSKFWKLEHIHFAYGATFSEARTEGLDDRYNLCWAVADEISEQVVYEIQHSETLFRGVSSHALLLWQTQVLAVLRKVAWEIDFKFGPILHDEEADEERIKAEKLETMRPRRGRDDIDKSAKLRRTKALVSKSAKYDAGNVASTSAIRERPPLCSHRIIPEIRQIEQDAYSDEIGEENDFKKDNATIAALKKIEKKIKLDFTDVCEKYKFMNKQEREEGVGNKSIIKPDFYGNCYEESVHIRILDDEQIMVANLNGSTYFPYMDLEDSWQHDDPINVLQPIAGWICDLKRHRHAALDAKIARSFLTILAGSDESSSDELRFSKFAPLIEERLGSIAWILLVQCVAEILQAPNPESMSMAVIYEWTRDAKEPWFAERRDKAIFIRGPFLDFPNSAAGLWNEKAAVILEEGGLILHKERGPDGTLIPNGKRDNSLVYSRTSKRRGANDKIKRR